MKEKEVWTVEQYRQYVSGRSFLKSSPKKNSRPTKPYSWDVPEPYVEGYRPKILSHIRPDLLIWAPTIGKSTNKTNGREHWKKRDDDVKFWQGVAADAVRRQKIRPVNGPVFVFYYLLFGTDRNVFDWTNCSNTAKLFEDGLVKAGIFPDDKKEFIDWGGLVPQAIPYLVSYTIVEIYELENLDNRLGR